MSTQADTSRPDELEADIGLGEEIDNVDGSDIDRVVNGLLARGGADAILGRFLRDRLASYFADVDPESCDG